MSEPAAPVIAAAARELGVPLRDTGEIRYCGEFYGQSGRGEPYPEGITAEGLVAIVERLPPGITELGCHPGLDSELDSSYRDERPREVEALCDPRVREAIERAGIVLRSFAPRA